MIGAWNHEICLNTKEQHTLLKYKVNYEKCVMFRNSKEKSKVSRNNYETNNK